MSEPSPLGRAALDYARTGWAVFPCKPRGKEPLTRNGLKDATTNLDVIRRWWLTEPAANIGLNCGKSGLMVIDLDKRADADGLQEWDKLLAEYQLESHTATSRTGGGGRHLLFRVPDGVTVKNSASKLAPGIDVRGDGGYIVLPPSVHPAGPTYCWEAQTEIEPAPEFVIRLLTTEPDPWRIYTLKDACQPRPPLVWVVDGLLAEGTLSIWYGAPGSLKSMLLADLAVCVAGGRHWLQSDKRLGGVRTTRSGVLWVDFDNGERRTHERFQAISQAHNVPASTPLYYVSMPDPYLDAGDTAAMSALAQRVVDRDVRLVVIDNLGVVSGVAEENTADMVRPMKGLRWLANTTGATVCVLHHQRKNTGLNARAGEALRGHSSIEAAIDQAILVQRDDLNVTIASTKDRGLRVQPMGALFDYENDAHHELLRAQFLHADPLTEETEEKSRRQQIEADALAYIKKFPNVTATQVYNEIGGNKKMVLDVLREMRLAGKLAEKQGGGMTRLLFVP